MSSETEIQGFMQSVGEIVTADFKYAVPAHQRDYLWTKDEVKQMWDDFMDAMDENRSEYFLGTIVVTEDRAAKIRAVIDGQQRLATLLMIFSAIRSAYLEHTDDRSTEIYATYLGAKDRRSRLTEPKLKLNRVNANLYRDTVIEPVTLDEIATLRKDRSQKKSNQLLLEAIQFIREQVNERIAAGRKVESFLLDLEDFVRDQVKLILVTAGDDADAYLIFETLNDRGLELSVSDLLKNYVYGKSGTHFDAVQQQWEEMLVLIQAPEMPQFLRHYWLSHFGVVREKDLYKALKQKFGSPQKVLSLVQDLSSAADRYAAISNPDHSIWTGYGTPTRSGLRTLQLFKLKQFRPLMLAALDTLPPREITKLINLIVVVSMRYSIISGLGPGNIERAYSVAAIQVRKREITTTAAIARALAAIYPNDQRFRSDFADKAVVGDDPKLARYILSQLAQAMQGGRVVKVIEDETEVNLEHIMPQSPNQYWKSAVPIESEYNGNVHRIGNLTLIEQKANQASANAPFKEKKKAYRMSEIKMTNSFCDYAAWTPREIGIRQDGLADIAINVWKV